MRIGKAYIRGYSFSRPPLLKNINSAALLAYRKKQLPPATHAEKLRYTRVIRDALSLYLGIKRPKEGKQPEIFITLKAQRQEIRKVATAARRFIEASDEEKKRNWGHRLLHLIDGPTNVPSINLATKDLLYRRLRRLGGDAISLKKHLHGDICYPLADKMLEALAADETGLIKLLKTYYADHPNPTALAIVTRDVSIRKAEFHDQFLFELVRTLAPVWKEATGRSPLPRSIDSEGDKKAYDFWQWLCSVIKGAGGTLPAYGAVRSIIYHLKFPE